MPESKNKLTPELVAIEAALGGLSPRPSGIQRDRLMFLAGRASAGGVGEYATARRGRLLWPCVAAASLLAAAVFASLWGVGRTSEVGGRPAANFARQTPLPTCDDPDDASPPSPPSPLENRRLCQLILEKGIEGLPRPEAIPCRGKPPPPRKDSYFDLLKQFSGDSST